MVQSPVFDYPTARKGNEEDLMNHFRLVIIFGLGLCSMGASAFSGCDTDKKPVVTPPPPFTASTEALYLSAYGENLPVLKGSTTAAQVGHADQKDRLHGLAGPGSFTTATLANIPENEGVLVIDQLGNEVQPGGTFSLFSTHTGTGFKNYIERRKEGGQTFFIPVVGFGTNEAFGQIAVLRHGTQMPLSNGNATTMSPGERLHVLGRNIAGLAPTDAEIGISPANAATRLDANGQAVAGTVGRSVRIDAVSGEVWITLNKVWSSQPGAAGQLLVGPVTINVTVQSVPQPTGNFVNWVGRYNPATGATTIWGRVPASYAGQTLRFTVAGTVFANRPVDERDVYSDGYIAPVQFTEPRGANQAYTITVEAGQGNLSTTPQEIVTPAIEQ